MWVRAKVKKQLLAHDPGHLQISYSIQEKQKWTAYYEPGVDPDLPWRVNHRLLNIRLSEEQFRELFVEVKFQNEND